MAGRPPAPEPDWRLPPEITTSNRARSWTGVASETSITCSLNFGGAGVAPGPTISQTFTYGVTTDKDDVYIALKAYRDAMDCSGDPGKINEIIQGAADDWRPGRLC